MITRRHLLRTLPAASAAGILSACEGPEPPPRFQLPKRPLSVVTTTVQAADLLREVGGEAVTVHSLIPALANPHLWQPTAADLSTVQTADVFVMSGLGLEANFKEDLESLRRTGLFVGVLGEVLTESEIIRPAEPTDPPDPHFWMSAALWARAAGKAAEVLAEASPPAANYFKDRGHEYASGLMLQQENILAMFRETLPQNRFVLSSHDSLRYLAQACGFTVRSLWDRKGGELAVEAQKALGEWIKEHKINTLLRENFTESAPIHEAMHPYGLKGNKLIVSLSLGIPGTLMSTLSEEVDVSRHKLALRYTCDTIYSQLILRQ